MNSSKHKQAIILFSVILPVILIGALFGGFIYGSGKLSAIHTAKEQNLKSFNEAKLVVTDLESQLAVGQRREQFAYWDAKLDQDLIPTLSATIDRILARYDDGVIKQTSMRQEKPKASPGQSTSPYTLVNLTFEGGFKPMQLLLAELEQELPQLMLQDLTMSPMNKGESAKKLSFSIIYHCWENPKN